MFWCVCLSTPRRGVPQPGPDRGGGVVPCWGVPCRLVGTSPRVPLHQTWPGGCPTLSTPVRPGSGGGGTLPGGGTPPRVTDGVLDTPPSCVHAGLSCLESDFGYNWLMVNWMGSYLIWQRYLLAVIGVIDAEAETNGWNTVTLVH